MSDIVELFPVSLAQSKLTRMIADATDSFSVESEGFGSLTGLAYTVPAHSEATIKASIKSLALTSVDVENLSALMRGMLSSSQYQKIREYESTHASANISYWGFWSGGGGASYEKTREEMRGFGLSEQNIQTIVSAMTEIAKNMSHVELEITVLNSHNNYAVSGNVLVYTIAGALRTANKQTQYRLIGDEGVAGSGNKTAPAKVRIVPLP